QVQTVRMISTAEQQTGQQVQAGVMAVVAHGGGVPLPDLNHAGGSETLERLANHRPGYTQHLREFALTGQRLAGRHFTAEHIGHDLLEDVIRYRTSIHGQQGHTATMPTNWPDVKWSDQ